MILATGGTIAGSAASDTATTGYQAGAIDVNALIKAVPEVAVCANVMVQEKREACKNVSCLLPIGCMGATI